MGATRPIVALRVHRSVDLGCDRGRGFQNTRRGRWKESCVIGNILITILVEAKEEEDITVLFKIIISEYSMF